MPSKPKMPLIDKLAGSLGAACIIALIALIVSHSGINKPKAKQTQHANTAIVRLHDVATGRFFCSGTVISDELILTAAHCVVRESFFGAEVVEQVEVRAEDGAPLGLIAKLVNANPRQDVALLSGQFKLFDKMPVEIRPQAIEDSFLHSRHLKACGYPADGALVCTTVSSVKHMNFDFSADGFLYPGMSGGPVIDEDTGAIIAVNTAVFESRIYLSPTEELFNQLRP